jgi:flagellar biosynthesis GTPase FlhF
MSTPGELLEALSRQARGRRAGAGDGEARTYRGRSVEELIPVIQRELGSEAIVVRRREGLTGGVLGFFQHPFVEIEAMPGAPRVDVYDEAHAAPPLPSAPAPAPTATAPEPPAAAPAPNPQPPASMGPPAPQPSLDLGRPPAPDTSRADPPASPAPAAPTTRSTSPGLPGLPGLPSSPAPAPAPAPVPAPASSPPAPAPFYAREPGDVAEPVAPASATGSAYVTAHLAALARADRSKSARRKPADRATTPGASPPVEPLYRRAASDRQRNALDPVEPVAWSSDSQEIAPSDVPELFPAAVEPARPATASAALREASLERRVVAPGSQARARAGVAKSLQRYGISDQLAHELIDGASAHALALAPRAGMAQAVRATLSQLIPVASPLPAKGAAIVVVGAGGAGKTTCCAALLGAYRKSSSLPASFATITRDPERAGRAVGAGGAERGELRMILSPNIIKPVPARAPRALRALRRARADGMAVLDTPNLSPSDRGGIRELAALLEELKPERVVVALPATLGAKAAAQLLEALAPLGANSLAVTHADETDQIGVAVEAACRFGLAPEYVLDRGRGGAWRLSRVDPAGLAARLLQ